MKYTIGKISTAIPRTVQGNFRRLLSSPHQPTEVGRPRIARSCAIKSAGFFILGSVKPRSSGRGYKRLGSQIQHQSAVELAHRLASGRYLRRHHGAEESAGGAAVSDNKGREHFGRDVATSQGRATHARTFAGRGP